MLTITELPIRRWTCDYKKMLESYLQPSGKGKSKMPPLVKDFAENHTDETVLFTIRLTPEGVEAVRTTKMLLKVFKLESSFRTSNMHLFNQDGRITRYTSPEHVLQVRTHPAPSPNRHCQHTMA